MRVAREQRVERSAQVRRLAVEQRRVALLLGERERPGRVPPGERRRLAGLVEPFARVEANRLEQAVAPLAPAFVRGDERLLDEPREHVGAAGHVEPVAGADRLDGGELEAAGEDGEPAEEHPLVGLEQVVAPLERRRERLLPRRRRAVARAEQAEAVVEPLGDRRRAERSQPARGELERERQAVEPEADAGDVRRVLLVEHESGRRRRRPLDEEPDRLVAEQLGRA